jgi:peptidoglycan hydrolase CwlO-like protein
MLKYLTLILIILALIFINLYYSDTKQLYTYRSNKSSVLSQSDSLIANFEVDIRAKTLYNDSLINVISNKDKKIEELNGIIKDLKYLIKINNKPKKIEIIHDDIDM